VKLFLSVFSKNAVYIVRMNRVDARKNKEKKGCGCRKNNPYLAEWINEIRYEREHQANNAQTQK